MRRAQTLLLLLILLMSSQLAIAKNNDSEQSEAKDPNLTITIDGVSDELKANLSGHLSPLPKTPAERRNFLFGVESAAEKAFQALGYYRARLTSDVIRHEDKPWELKLEVRPGEPVRYQSVDIALFSEAQSDPAFEAILEQYRIDEGDTLHHGIYENLKSELQNLGLSRGYFDGRLIANRLEIDRRRNLAKLILHYDSGQRYHFGNVDFSEFDLKPELLDALVPFTSETPYHIDEMARLTSNLSSAGYFKDIKVLPHPEKAEQGHIPVEVDLSPAPKHSYAFGIGYSTDTEARVTATWRTPKINRYGHSQETKLSLSQVNPEISFNYRIPLGHPLNDQLLFGASIGNDEFGDLESTQYQLRVSRRTVIANSWTRELFIRGLHEEWDQANDSRQASYVFAGLSFSKTRRRGPALDPSSGFRQRYSIEHADELLGSEQRVTRLRSQWRFITTPIERHRVTGRLDLGVNVIDDEELLQLAPSLRFFAGGDQSIRGFDYQTQGPTVEFEDGGETKELVVGGRYLTTASIEYQYYFLPKWRVAAFVDGGNAFDSRESDDLDLLYSVGTGLHWISPVGPVKVDVGYGISEPDPEVRFHITIGAEI